MLFFTFICTFRKKALPLHAKLENAHIPLMKTRILSFITTLLLSLALSAQTVTHVFAQQVGNTIEITYDLDKPAIVSLLLSRDGGANYAATPKTVTGDVGAVTSGHKKMVWDLFADASQWEIQRARFKVVAQKQDKISFTVNGVTFTMISVEGGTFTMGCTSEQGSDCYNDEKPSHQVTLTDYYIGKTEVTQALWKAVMGTNPSSFKKGDNYPVETVSWEDCQTFVQKLNSLLSSQLGGKRFALPTEAQWEYAARGGHKQPPYQYKYSGSDNVGSVAWYHDNSNGAIHPVATKSPNTLGVYDMSGNIMEWCQNGYRRGGSFAFIARICRVSYRSGQPSFSDVMGLRLVCQ